MRGILSKMRGNSGGRRAGAVGRGAVGSELLLCRLDDGTVHAMHARKRAGGVTCDYHRLDTARDARALRARLGRNCPIVALLDKREYMMKHLQIPRVEASEASEMVRLEAEASLPPSFGETVISHLPLPEETEGRLACEVYVARADVTESLLQAMGELGMEPSHIIPSAVAWRSELRRSDDTDLLVSEMDDGQRLEVAVPHDQQGLRVRTLEVAGEDSLPYGLVECLRTARAGRDADAVVTVLWAGQHMPTPSLHGQAHLRAAEGLRNNKAPLLELAARALLDSPPAAGLGSVNLLPRQRVDQQRRHGTYRHLAIAVAASLLALGLVQASLMIWAARYERRADELADRIAQIRREGEALGRRRDQLRAVRSARLTQSDFHDILTGLYEATPEGITYSQIETTPEGVIRLRGQAKSISLPYLLPRELAKQPMFSQALVKDAGQVKRRGGPVTRFHVEAQLERGR